MHLTKEQLLVMLKKAYVRGIWDHIEQKTQNNYNLNVLMSMSSNIPDHVVEDLIKEVENENS